MKILWYSLRKSKFSFYFIVYRPMRVSDVISNVTKQNMKVMASTSTSPCKCKICISSPESDVYNKKKIQMFGVNMTFISSREVKKNVYFIRAFGTHEIYIFHFTR